MIAPSSGLDLMAHRPWILQRSSPIELKRQADVREEPDLVTWGSEGDIATKVWLGCKDYHISGPIVSLALACHAIMRRYRLIPAASSN